MVGVRQFDEQHVLAQALELFWRQGFAATSMPDLAAQTKVQRGSLYNAYGDKETLFLRAFDIYAQRFLDGVHKGLSAENAADALTGFFQSAVANMTAGSPPRGCLTTKTATDGSLSSPKIAERIRTLLNDLEALVADRLAGREHELVLTPIETATVVVTFTRGLAVMERVHGDPGRLMATAAGLTRSLTLPQRPAPAGRKGAGSPRRATAAPGGSRRPSER